MSYFRAFCSNTPSAFAEVVSATTCSISAITEVASAITYSTSAIAEVVSATAYSTSATTEMISATTYFASAVAEVVSATAYFTSAIAEVISAIAYFTSAITYSSATIAEVASAIAEMVAATLCVPATSAYMGTTPACSLATSDGGFAFSTGCLFASLPLQAEGGGAAEGAAWKQNTLDNALPRVILYIKRDGLLSKPFCGAFAGQVSGGEGDLEVVASGWPVEVEQLAGHVEAFYEFRLHCLWIDIL